MVWDRLFGPVTVMVTFDVPAGVVYFTPLMLDLQPESVIDAPARRKISPTLKASPRCRSRRRAPARPPNPISITGHPSASTVRVACLPGRSAADAEASGARSDQTVMVTGMDCCQ